jgi:hypothetical protein
MFTAILRWTHPPRRYFSDLHRSHPHRTRLTNLLWKDRYAIGAVNVAGVPNTPPRSPGPASGEVEPYRIVPKRMRDSYQQVILPFRADLQLREEYVNFFRGLRYP